MNINDSLLEFYQKNSDKIDILMDEEALFILALIQQLGRPTLNDLIKHIKLEWKTLLSNR